MVAIRIVSFSLHHYQQAGHTKAYLRYTEAAGDRATAQGDAGTATRHYLTALSDHSCSAARIRLGLKLGNAALSAMPDDAIIPALRRTLTEDAPPRAAAGELRLYLGTLMRNHQLSPREHQVAVLAGRGLSNRAIAEQLNLSPRTAEHHVANALRKLGVSSRTQLADTLATTTTTTTKPRAAE